MCGVLTDGFAHRVSSRPEAYGSGGAKEVATRFSGVEVSLDIRKFGPRIGIFLNANLYILTGGSLRAWFPSRHSGHQLDFGILLFDTDAI